MNQNVLLKIFLWIYFSFNILFSGKALSQSCDNWLSLPSQGSKLTIGDADVSGNKLTVEAMFNRTAALNNGLYYGHLVSKHTDQTNANYALLPNGCEITTNVSGYKAIFQTCVPELNKTYHVAMVYDGTTLKFYRNGFVMSQVACTGNLVNNNLATTIAQLAGNGDPAINQFLGYVNEVRIWKVARSQSQIQAYMDKTLPNPASQTGLVASYSFDNTSNKQGNTTFNGVITGGAITGITNAVCSLTPSACNTVTNVQAGFTIPDTVCVNTPVNISNISLNATSSYWNFCVADPNTAPTAVNLGNPGGRLSLPVFTDIVNENGNYYVFVSNNWPGGLVRLDFGNSLLNTPTAVDLGTAGGIIPNTIEGIQIVKNEGRWYAIMVGGDIGNGGIPSRIIKLDFGVNITNTNPVGTNWGNIGNLAYPVDLHVFQENGNWYGFTVNAQNNTITRFNFSNSFNNVPTALNLGNLGGLNFPTGLYAVKDNSNWHLFITNDVPDASLTRMDFGTSLLNTNPTAVNLGNPNGTLYKTRDIYFLKDCDKITALAVNAVRNDLVKLDFNNNITAVPSGVSLGNIGSFDFPHSISKLFRAGNDLYTFVTNVSNNTITRIRFEGCTNANTPNSSSQNPPPVTYNSPGIYNINLTIDEGLPTQASICKQIVVKDCTDSLIINEYTPLLSFDPCKNILNVEDASKFNIGDTVLMIQMKGADIDSSNGATFGTIRNYNSAGNYEFNYIKTKNGNRIELVNAVERQYDVSTGKVQLIRVPYFVDYTPPATLTCLPWDGSKGGVLAFNVQNRLTLNTDIDVSGRGFKGGVPLNNSIITCDQQGYFYNAASNNGGQKGEGIHTLSVSKNYGRGAPSNAGGGGNAHNAGGGGGSNAGNGGHGGNQWDGCQSIAENIGGKGGVALTNSSLLNKLYLGGGGGMGHGNDQNEYPAGNGGGIVIFSAATIAPNGKVVKANGTDALTCPGSSVCNDGMSGGGAGGSVLMDIKNVIGNVSVEAKGGNGANSNYIHPVYPDYKVGPGGGGGGGLFAMEQPTISSLISFDISGGNNGVLLNHGSTNYGATKGGNGKGLSSFVFFKTKTVFKPNIDSVKIKSQALSCNSFSFIGQGYTNTNPVVSWFWNFGDSKTAIIKDTDHSYSTQGDFPVKLLITDSKGCTDSTSIQVSVAGLDFDFDYKQDVCDPLVINFNGLGGALDNSFWDFGDGTSITGNSNPGHVYTQPGNYLVKYSTGTGNCIDTVRKTISINILREDIILTKDRIICDGSTRQLRTIPSLGFCWFPATYLDDPNSPNPTTSPLQDITYYFTAEIAGTNLITNGDFSAGNSGFTSQYTFTASNTTEGQYYVGTNPASWNNSLNSCQDHSSGAGNMMMINGSPAADVNIWKQTVTVIPNTNYSFSTWIQSLWPPNPAQLRFSINGQEIGDLITADPATCTWKQFYTTWNSGDSTTAVISIVNKNVQVQGNDFALDDISFAPVFVKRDSVKIVVEKPVVTASNDTAICAGASISLNASGANKYAWSPATGLNNAGIANPVATPGVSTQYIVTGTTINGCFAKDTIQVNLYDKPVVGLSNDTLICKNAQVQLSASGGVAYDWSPAVGLNNQNISDPLANPVASTKYFVRITDINTCTYIDSVEISIRPDAVFSLEDAGKICLNDSAQLRASGGDRYSWQASDGISDVNIPDPRVSPSVTTNYFVTITETVCNQSAILNTTVEVQPLPVVRANRSNDIDCSNDRSQLMANGAVEYEWTPSASLNNNRISAPVATPEITTDYIVAGTDTGGCTGYDTITVRVDNSNKNNYLLPNAFTPNNDGLNDCFGIKYWGVVEKFEFSIYNRWGERLFTTKNPSQCWDGTFKGIPQDGGVYVYMIKAKTSCEAEVFRKGTFTLVK